MMLTPPGFLIIFAGQVRMVFIAMILLENVSTYLQIAETEYTEAEFLKALTFHSGCFLLLDINNIYVNAHNHSFNAEDFLMTIPTQSVKQFHLGGFEERELFIDTHGAAINEPVWALFKKAIARFGSIPATIEWDNNIPPLEKLLGEAKKAESFYNKENFLNNKMLNRYLIINK
jgi:uncharacterized protein (UPF0276 family)